MPKDKPNKKQEQRLLQYFKKLDATQRQSLLDYAEYLLQKYPLPEQFEQSDPLSIPRPVQETVIGAIKRLRKTYPMIDASALLNETSSLMAQHLVQGRGTQEVIDELENLFARRFEELSSS